MTADTDGQNLPPLPKQLVESVMSQEKYRAILLLAIKATMAPNQSVAMQVLQQAGGFGCTLGVFTMGNKVADDVEHDREK